MWGRRGEGCLAHAMRSTDVGPCGHTGGQWEKNCGEAGKVGRVHFQSLFPLPNSHLGECLEVLELV